MTAAAVCYYMRRELTALQSLIPLDQGFRIAARSSMTTVAEAVQSRLSFFIWFPVFLLRNEALSRSGARRGNPQCRQGQIHRIFGAWGQRKG